MKNEALTGKKPASSILVVDIGGTKIKVLVSGQIEPRKIESRKGLTPTKMVEAVKKLTQDWDYQVVSIGYPGQVGENGPRSEPGNLGSGWVGFDFAAAFGCPVRIINDAAMQALGSYEGGRMLFLGLGTGLGSAFITEKVIVSLELGELPYRDTSLWKILGRRGLKKLGKRAWRQAVGKVVPELIKVFLVDYVVLGGGNAKMIKKLPPGTRLGHNLTAFLGGFHLWSIEDVQTLSPNNKKSSSKYVPVDWRLI